MLGQTDTTPGSYPGIIDDLGRRARNAALQLATIPSETKNRALHGIANAIDAARQVILDANSEDLKSAKERGTSAAMLDRLRLDDARIAKMSAGVRHVATLPDPVGETLTQWTRDDGLEITKTAVPIGVIGIIYESRPNVTADAAVLCLKAGNATILRGGSEAFRTNRAIETAIQSGIVKAGLPGDSVQLVPFTDRQGVDLLAGADRYVDLLIPRGGRGLIEAVTKAARVPVIKHYDGICAAYIHAEADLKKAIALVLNGKTQRPGVCNALETLLVDASAAPKLLPPLADALLDAHVELRCDPRAADVLAPRPVRLADDTDFRTEFLDLIIAVKVVNDIDDAIDHINSHGSRHSDLIVTENADAANRFLAAIDSATVYWNASTRFTDGGEFGFGAEIGISTDKLHARGPMGLRELTSYKYLLRGNGQIRGC